jgi:hypothetical protein
MVIEGTTCFVMSYLESNVHLCDCEGTRFPSDDGMQAFVLNDS